jgi:hypothetical protein
MGTDVGGGVVYAVDIEDRDTAAADPHLLCIILLDLTNLGDLDPIHIRHATIPRPD